MKRLFKFKYPKLLLLIILIIVAYFIFSNPDVKQIINHLGKWGYLSSFIAGILFSFGFTTPFAVGFFINLSPDNILLTGMIGGLGAVISDLLIFKIVKISFKDEFNRISKTTPIRNLSKFIDHKLSYKIRIYLLYAFAGIVIASPLPDELGVIMLAGLTKIKILSLSIISFTFNTLGILIIISL